MALRRGCAGRALALAVALAALACATQPAARDTGLLFLWEVESGPPAGARVHLFGSVHVAKQDLRLDPAVEAAFAGASALVVELDLRAISLEESGALILRHGRLPEGQQLDAILPESTWTAFAALLERHGQSAVAYRGFEPWVAMVVASALLAGEQELEEEHGVDRGFLARAGEREVIALETVEYQLSLFDQLSFDQQARLLDAVVSEPESASESLGLLYEAWRLGDTETVASLVAGSADDDPALAALQERMFASRNRAMARRIEALLREPRDGGGYFVVVGAGHLVGASGIPALLAQRGLRVRRVERSR